MKIVVTGAAGFIGSNLTRFLLRKSGHTVLAIDNLTYAGNRRSLSDLDCEPTFHFAQADICDSSKMRDLVFQFEPHVIMHLAAESHVDRSIDGPDAFIQTNIVGTYRLLQVARTYFEKLEPQSRVRFRFHHVSTDEVFGSLGPTEPAFTESSRYDPRSPYSGSKAASDHLVRAWHATFGFPAIITNCSNNYGPYQFPEKLIPHVILKALSGEPIPVYGKGENIRDWLFVDDHTRALEAVVTCGRVGQTYNIGGNNELTNIEVVRTLCSILDELHAPEKNGLEIQSYAELIQFVDDRPGHDMRYAINTEKIRAELGWAPEESFASGIRKTVLWYLENRGWCRDILSGEYQLERLGLFDD